MARIEIENLGPINRLSLKIEQFNLLIGEQAVGKSTICKTIFFFREIKNSLIDYLYNISIDGRGDSAFPTVLNKKMKSIFIQLFGYSWYLPINLSASYYYNEEIYVRIKVVKPQGGRKYLSLSYSEVMKQKVFELESYAQTCYENLKEYDSNSGFSVNERSRLHAEIEKKVCMLLEDDMATYYIPAGRGLLSLMTNQKTRFDYDMIDLVNRRFMQFIETIQPRFDAGVSGAYRYFPTEERKYDVHKVADQIISSMKGEYIFSKGQEYLREKTTNEQIRINFASSGQQELLWLFNQLYVLLLKNEKAFVIIEEPEAHVYPILQREVLEFIVQYMNFTGSTVLVTTHSPYILTSTNNLYYGGRLIAQNSELKPRVEKILGRGKYILPEKAAAHKLFIESGETKAENLLEEETGDLKSMLIDEVSEEINRHYTELFYLEDEYEDTRVG